MGIIKPKGLKGLSSLGGLRSLMDNEAAYDNWKNLNKDKIRNKSFDWKDRLYRNQQFMKMLEENPDIFNQGSPMDYFNSMSVEARDKLYKDFVVEKEWNHYAPTFKEDGTIKKESPFGDSYFALSKMSSDDKLTILNNFVDPKTLEKKIVSKASNSFLRSLTKEDKEQLKNVPDPIITKDADFNNPELVYKAIKKMRADEDAADAQTIPTAMTSMATYMSSSYHPVKYRSSLYIKSNEFTKAYDKYNKAIKEQNDIIDKAYNHYIKGIPNDETFKTYEHKVLGELDDMSEKDINKLIMNIQNGDGKYTGNNYLKTYYKNENEKDSSFDKFALDEKKAIIAKDRAFKELGYSELERTSYLDSYFHNYIADHQSWWYKAKDEWPSGDITMLQKLNSDLNPVYFALDNWYNSIGGYGKSQVWVDTKGKIYAPEEIQEGKKGNPSYVKGTSETVTRQAINNATLWHQGKDEEGRDRALLNNPAYWEKALQYKTLNPNRIKEADEHGGLVKGGALYEDGKPRNFLWEAFGMRGFVQASLIEALLFKKVGGMTGIGGPNASTTARTMSKVGQALWQLNDARSIAGSYATGTHTKVYTDNLNKLENIYSEIANQNARNRWDEYSNSDAYKRDLEKEKAVIRRKYRQRTAQEKNAVMPSEEVIEEFAKQALVDKNLSRMQKEEREKAFSSEEYKRDAEHASEVATNASTAQFFGELGEYSLANATFRKYMFNFGKAPAVNSFNKGLTENVKTVIKNGKEVAINTAKNPNYLTFLKTINGGAITNLLDETQSIYAEKSSNHYYNDYLIQTTNGKAYTNLYSGLELSGETNTNFLSSLSSEEWSRLGQAYAVAAIGSIFPNPFGLLNAGEAKSRNKATLKEIATRNVYSEARDANGNITESKGDLQKRRAESKEEFRKRRVGFTGKGKGWWSLNQWNSFLQIGPLNEYLLQRDEKEAVDRAVTIANTVMKNPNNSLEFLKKTLASMPMGYVKGNEDDNKLSTLDRNDKQFIQTINLLQALKNQATGEGAYKLYGNLGVDPTLIAEILSKTSTYKQVEDALRVFPEEETLLSSEDRAIREQLITDYLRENGKADPTKEDRAKAVTDLTANINNFRKGVKALQEAEEAIAKVEKSRGEKVNPIVRDYLKEQYALREDSERRANELEEALSGNNMFTANASPSVEEASVALGSKKAAELTSASMQRKAEEAASTIDRLKERRDKLRMEILDKKDELSALYRKHKRGIFGVTDKAAKAKISSLQQELTKLEKERTILDGNIDKAENTHAKYLEAAERTRYIATNAFTSSGDNATKSFVEEFFGNIDLNNTESIARATQKFLSMNIKERARLLNNIETEIEARKAIADKTKLPEEHIFTDKEFRILNAIYNHIKNTLEVETPGIREMIKDVDILNDRRLSLTDDIEYAIDYPTYASNALEAIREADAEAAASQFNAYAAENIGDFLEKNFIIDSLRETNDPIEKQALLELLYKIVSRCNSGILTEMLNNSHFTDVKSVVQDAMKFNEQLMNVVSAVHLNSVDISLEAANEKAAKLAQAIFSKDKYGSSKTVYDIVDDLLVEGYSDVDLEKILNTISRLHEQEMATNEKSYKEIIDNLNNNREAKREKYKKKLEEEKKRKLEQKSAEALVTPESKTPSEQTPPSENIAHKSKEGSNIGNPPSTESAEQSGMNAALEQSKMITLSDGTVIKGEQSIEVDDEGNLNTTDQSLIRNSALFEYPSNAPEDAELKVVTPPKLALGEDGKYSVINKGVAIDNNTPINEQGIILSDPISFDDNADNPIINASTQQETSNLPPEQQKKIKTGNVAEFNKSIETPQITISNLGGHVLPAYTISFGVETRKVPYSATLQDHFSLMQKFGLDIDAVVNEELPLIFKDFPNTSVKIIQPNSQRLGLKGLQNVLYTAIELTPELKKYHKETNGKTVTIGDKEYLFIGTLGYSPNTPQQLSFLAIKDDITATHNRSASRENSDFFVSDKYSTVVEKMTPGFLVKQMATDSEVKIRSVVELLEDPQRNQNNYTIEDLAFGIQKGAEFTTIGAGFTPVYAPKNAESNAGSAFVLVHSGTREYMPVKIEPTIVGNLKEGSTLKERIIDALTRVTSTDINIRKQAASDLSKLLHFDSENGLMLYIGNGELNRLRITNKGITEASFELNSPTFELSTFLETFFNKPFIVQLSQGILSSPVTIREYAEAGALNVDVAKLGTSRVGYTVKAMDANGNIVETTPVQGSYTIENTKIDSVLFNNTVYRKINGQWVTNTNAPVSAEIKVQLEWNNYLNTLNLQPFETTKDLEFYIISTDPNNPQVIQKNKNTQYITQLPKDRALKALDHVNKQQATADRMNNAQIAADNIEIIDLNIDAESGEPEIQENPNKPKDIEQIEKEGDKNPPATLPVMSKEPVKEGTGQTFVEAFKSDKMFDILDVLDSKYPDHPNDIGDLQKFLSEKGIETNNITDVDSWVSNIRDC